ncbi:hypothetical protein ONS95_003884 [Cadophora gregata]|uniref:uncharacterized protein n=1 Tax=Cadophora gregata TaxID=51156 RepID=UPI0026DDCA67|nr:uncharacterized protein ONS95_003884 [Cadophora gregata]KAK0107179.1 hypothetical protein ONS95_003884 [Cadophora gregata]
MLKNDELGSDANARLTCHIRLKLDASQLDQLNSARVISQPSIKAALPPCGSFHNEFPNRNPAIVDNELNGLGGSKDLSEK